MTALRIYEASECGSDGYPLAWHDLGNGQGVKHLIREQAGLELDREETEARMDELLALELAA